MADTQLIKDKLDIVATIQEYVPLKKAGVYWKAPCPFHREKTPSFMVNSEKQIWKCFGCGKGGDIFSFIQEMEGMDFVEALKLLADRAGVKIDTYRSEIDKSQKNRILEINQKAAHFFHHILTEMDGAKIAREYLEKRGLKKETIETWQVGFIPDQWDLLTQYFLKKGIGVDDLVAAGLVIKKDPARAGQGFYDRFRGRIMFPIWDVHGNVVGFTGRVLVETENSGGKYVNTPQTLAYDKSRVIYGLDKAKIEIKTQDQVVLVEGQMDVIACHQAGMKNVVASSGTALGLEQIKLLKRYSNNIAIAFDGDSAGVAAAKRGIDIALSEGLNVKAIRIPEGKGKDADECLKNNSEVWFSSVKNASDVLHWFFEMAFLNKSTSDPKEKQKIANELLPIIGLIPYAVERDYWLKELAGRLGTDTSVLRDDMKRFNKNKKSIQDEKLGGNSKNVANLDRLDMLLKRFLMILVYSPQYISSLLSSLKEEYWQGGVYEHLYEFIKNHYNSNQGNAADVWRNFFDGSEFKNDFEDLKMTAQIQIENLEDVSIKDELVELVVQIKEEWVKKRRKEIGQKLALVSAEKNPDKQLMEKLLIELQSI
ncbi:MAG: DNA primase [Candidatus Magasanikbacteria bacterium]